MPPLAERLARYSHELDATRIPRGVVAVVKQRLLDSLACALGAYDAAPVTAACDLAERAPTGQASIFGRDMRTSPDLAAFVNGAMVRFLDYNDGYMGREPGHPSDQIPACIAVAETEGRAPSDLIAAIVVAYEIQMRLQDAASLNKRGWDQAAYILVSSAAACSRLMGLDIDQTTHAINLALNGHIPMRQVRSGTLSDWKGCSAPNAARNAVFAAMLARAGMTGPAPIFEGAMGFFEQVTGPFDLDVASFGNPENGDYAILRSLTKTFPTNGELHTAVWAGIELKGEVRTLDDIASIRIETSEFNVRVLADAEKWSPRTRETADHSLPYNVARALVDGDIGIGSYTPEAISDPRIARLMKMTEVVEDPELTKLFPAYLANRITLSMRGGETLTCEKLTGPGGRENPMTDAHFEAKFDKMARLHLTDEARSEIKDYVGSLENQIDYAPLFSAMASRRRTDPDHQRTGLRIDLQQS